MSSFFAPLGFKPMEIASIGLTMLVSGIFGAAFTGWFLSKTAAYKKVLLFMMIVTLLMGGLLGHQLIFTRSLTVILVYMIVLGVSMISVVPTSLDLGVELTFPLQPALVNGTMFMIAQGQGFIQSIIYSAMLEINRDDYATAEEFYEAQEHNIVKLMIVMAIFIIIPIVCVVFVREDLKRLRFKEGETNQDIDDNDFKKCTD